MSIGKPVNVAFHEAYPVAAKPAPGLSPDMLSEEDREHLKKLRFMASYMNAMFGRYSSDEQVAITWADRLLADNHGEG